jgi:hypothetical protein
VVAHVFAAPSKPEIPKSVRAGRVIPQIGIAESTEGMETAPFNSELFQNGVKVAPQDVALAERLPPARTEDVSAVAATDEVGKQLRHVRVEVNDAMGVRGLWCLCIASPHGLLDLDATAIEVPNFKAKQLTSAKSRRRIKYEEHFHLVLDCRENPRDLLPSQEFFGLIPDAMAAVRHALRVEKNPTIALAVLERTGVSAHRGERMQLPETARQDGYSRQAVMIANVLLEGREHMGLDLGPEIEQALAKDLEQSTDAAKTSQAKLPRLSDSSGNGSRRRKVTSRD